MSRPDPWREFWLALVDAMHLEDITRWLSRQRWVTWIGGQQERHPVASWSTVIVLGLGLGALLAMMSR